MKPQFHLPLSTYPDASSFTIIDNAIDLTWQNDAHLVASIPQVRVPQAHQSFPTAIDVDTWRGQAERYSRDSGTSLREHLTYAVSETRIQTRIHGFEATEPFVYERFSEIARCHDLSIIEASEVSRQFSETLLFGSGRPLVLFPATSVCSRVDMIAVAWDGSATAARALSCARIFFERDQGAGHLDPDDKQIDEVNRALLISSSKYSGLDVENVSIQARGETAAAAIQSAALERKADLLVAGGFGHSRLREFILGGVTRELLVRAELPVLLARHAADGRRLTRS
ncbi:universal stress protein [Rhizobium aegyptiacum]|uniref:universal stress protein n=1 Tax=Rhizobium aegyptiacum TaxID=1764550 RepID=UPI0007E5981A|nr:universal stress protein [Rhizobium aegyptiacum]